MSTNYHPHMSQTLIHCGFSLGPSAFRLALVLFLPLLGRAALQEARAQNAVPTAVQVPEDAKRVTISLAYGEQAGRQPGYLMQRAQEPAAEVASLPQAIAESYAGKEFFAYELATLPDQTRYLLALNEEKNLKFITRNDSAFWYARIYRVLPGSDSKPEILREGLQTQGNDVTVPVKLTLPGIGTTHVKEVRTEIGYSLNSYQSGKPQIYTGRGTVIQVSGSQIGKEGKLTLTVDVPAEMAVTPNTAVFLRFEPLVPGLPERMASGKMGEYLTLGSARLVVVSIEPDFSKATLAVVAGSLEETLKEQLQLGTEMPPFSQVELITRTTCTREQVLGKTKERPGTVFVFGDLVSSQGRSPYGPPSAMTGSLPLPAPEIAEQLALELNPKPLLVFVTRQIGVDFLYVDLRNKTPDYLVLTDFADPLRTTFRTVQPGPGYYGPPMQGGREPSLRQLFNLPERTLSIAAFDSNGKVIYVKADAGTEFLPSLAEARRALKK